MKYVYNEKISRKANENLSRRSHKVMIQKRVLALVGILIISLFVLLGSCIRTFASSYRFHPMHKYYTSIQIENGDNLWNLADRYTVDGVYGRDDFIEETCKLNQLSDKDQLHAGDYLVVCYYSEDNK